MAILIKDKNFLIFTNNKNLTYKFDILTARFYSIGNEFMDSAPIGFASCLQECHESNVLNFMYQKHRSGVKYEDMTEYAEHLTICDKLDSLNATTKAIDFDILFTGKYFKQFAKMHNENNNLTVQEFINTYGKIVFFQELGLKENEYYTKEILNLIWDWRNLFSTKELIYIAYYLSRGVYDFLDSHVFRLVTKNELFRNFFMMAKHIEYVPTKSDFFKQYIMVQKNYNINKMVIDNKLITTHLDKHKKSWDFETDELIVIAPKTVDEFKDESIQQDNCVYSIYLNQVIEGKTNIVFIRKKSSPSESYITCEVSNQGHIRQYLTKYNRIVPKNDIGFDFLLKFQKYIDNTWN